MTAVKLTTPVEKLQDTSGSCDPVFFWTAVLNVMLYVVVSRSLDKHLQVRIYIYIVALHINRESSPKLKWQTLLGSKNRGAELVWCNAQQKHLLQKLLRLLCLSSACTKFHSKKTSQLAERLLSLFRFGICIHQSTIADDCWAHLSKHSHNLLFLMWASVSLAIQKWAPHKHMLHLGQNLLCCFHICFLCKCFHQGLGSGITWEHLRKLEIQGVIYIVYHYLSNIKLLIQYIYILIQ